MTPTVQNPLLEIQQSAQAVFMPYGEAAELVESFGEYEAEYAAIRKGVAIFDMPQRGLIPVRGTGRQSFLQAMLTNDVGDQKLGTGAACRAFLLNKQGRIEADMVVANFQDDTSCLVLDRADAARVSHELDKYLFTEDAQLEDASETHHHLALHGPEAAKLIEHVADKPVASLEPNQCDQVEIAGHKCLRLRHDETLSVGLHLLVPADSAISVYQQLAEAIGGLVPQVEGGTRRNITGRGIGWLAYNTARIEAGRPIYHVDFGPDTLAHETGVLHEAVSFTKGCYLGQEIVARMENLGHPKRILVALKCADDRLPIAGTQVLDADDSAVVIGAVTSSTLSPMLGNTAIALAMVKWGKHRPDTEVKVAAEGELVPAKAQQLAELITPS